MVAPFRINSLTFNGGSVIDTSHTDIVVLVGPNNSGKTRTLSELHMFLSSLPAGVKNVQRVALQTYAFSQQMGNAELDEWLKANRYYYTHRDTLAYAKTFQGGDLAIQNIDRAWNSTGNLGELASHLVRNCTVHDRLQIPSNVPRLEFGQHPDHLLQFLATNPERMQLLRDSVKSAFDFNLILEGFGSTLKLRLSKTLTQGDLTTSTSNGLFGEDIADKIKTLTPIEIQGEGVRSFFSILMTVVSMRYPLILLDEPEMFLHPPQARLLARHLAALCQDGQIFLATHSLDILLGLLSSAKQRIQVVRLTRSEDKTYAAPLNAEDLRSLWNDQLLRFSRALEGIFHQGVVVCEGDTDAAFYDAVGIWISEQDSSDSHKPKADLPKNPFDVMYTHTNGKDRMAVLAKALRAVQVPVSVIADFDLLNSKQSIQKLLGAMGCTMDDAMEQLRRDIDAGIRGCDAKLTVGVAKAAMEEALRADPDIEVTQDMARKIKNTLEDKKGWAQAKKNGLSILPRGDSRIAGEKLLGLLQESGLHVVPSGAVESFVPVVGHSGPEWIAGVFAGDHIPRATEAHAFIGRLLTALAKKSPHKPG